MSPLWILDCPVHEPATLNYFARIYANIITIMSAALIPVGVTLHPITAEQEMSDKTRNE